MKSTKVKIRYPRKLKKRLKKIGQLPKAQYLYTYVVENNTTATLDCLIFGDKKYTLTN